MKKWKSPLAYTAIGAILGSSLMTTLPAYADSGFKEFWGKMFQNGQYVQQAPAIAYNGTSYFGIWYIQHLLQQDGITATWNGQSLQLSSVPVQQSTTLSTTANGTSTGTATPVNSINIDGVTYVPLASVQALLQQSGAGIGLKSPEDGGDNGDGQAGNGPSLQAPIEQVKGALDKLEKLASDSPKGHGEDAHASFEQFFGAIAKLQTAVVELQAAGTVTGTSGTTSTTGGTTTGTTTGTTGTTTTSTASVASVTTALQADIASLMQLLSTTTGGVTSGSTTGVTSGSGSTSTATGTTTGGTAGTTGSTTTTTATPATFASVVEDIMLQLAALESLQGPNQGDSHHDDAMARS